MRWLYFVFAAICFALLLRTQSLGLAALELIGMLGFMLAGVLSLASARIEGSSRDQGQIVDLDTLKQIREQAERRKAAAEADADRDDQAPANPA